MLAATRHSTLHNDPIPLAEIDARISSLPGATELIGVDGRRYSCDEIRLKLGRLSNAGEKELCPPWPGPDKQMRSGWLWKSYSDQQILLRTKAVFEGALEGYKQIVGRWFSKFATGLQLALTLPARLVGVVIPPGRGAGTDRGPIMIWYLEPLPYGSATRVDVELGEQSIEMHWDRLQLEWRRFRSLRPHTGAQIGFAFHKQLLDIFQPDAATELVYRWLGDDLRRIRWAR